MKTISYLHIKVALILSAGIFIVISSCSDLIEEDPAGTITTDNFFETEEDLISAVNGIYNNIGNNGAVYRQRLYYLAHIGTDIAIVNPAERNDYANEATTYTLNASTSRIEGTWSTLYSAIARANTVIDRTANIINVKPEIRDRAIGEAKFLRALSYFLLTNIWGGVPLIMNEVTDISTVDDVTRNSTEEVYSSIIQDLSDAEQLLPSTYDAVDLGRATSGAASALLGKVYLFNKQWGDAETKLREVITSGLYDLLPSYEEVFYSRNDNGVESIFEIQFLTIPGAVWSETWQGYNIAPTFGSPEVPGGADVKGGGWASILPTQEFFDSFDPVDVRKDVNLYTEWTDDSGLTTVFENGPYINKYNDERSLPYPGPANGELNYKIIRYADVLLMLAEAINEQGGPTGEAYDAVNLIRQRAGLPDLANLDQSTFRDAILQERAWELSYEGHRRFDLVRMNKLVDAVQNTASTNPVGAANVQEFHGLYPIPQNIIDVSPGISQNPGY